MSPTWIHLRPSAVRVCALALELAVYAYVRVESDFAVGAGASEFRFPVPPLASGFILADHGDLTSTTLLLDTWILLLVVLALTLYLHYKAFVTYS